MKSKLHNTRFSSLQYTCEAPNQWTIVDAESTKEFGYTVPIGPKYASKDELLADLDRFATERGYNGNTKLQQIEANLPANMHSNDKAEYLDAHNRILEIEDNDYNTDQLEPLKNRAHLIISPYIQRDLKAMANSHVHPLFQNIINNSL